MHELLHLIGLCPDSFGHLDLIDLLKYTVDPGIRHMIENVFRFVKIIK